MTTALYYVVLFLTICAKNSTNKQLIIFSLHSPYHLYLDNGTGRIITYKTLKTS